MKLKDCHDGGICLNEMLIEDLLAALRPLAALADAIPRGWPDDRPIYDLNGRRITAGEARRAYDIVGAARRSKR